MDEIGSPRTCSGSYRKPVPLNLVIKEFVVQRKVLISYVRDLNGFRKGIVVAIGPGKIGWSLVNKKLDVRFQLTRPEYIPVVRTAIEQGTTMSEVIKHPAYQRCVASRNLIAIPVFNRDVGLLIALDRAMRAERVQLIDDEIVGIEDLPYDVELRQHLKKVIPIAKKYF